LTYGSAGEELAGFADANGNIAEDCHATSGYTFTINDGAISWSAKHQEVVTLFTTESKYISAMCHKLHLAISSLILQQFLWSQWLPKALEKTFQ